MGANIPFGINRCWYRFAVRHTRTIKNVCGVPLLRQVKTSRRTLHINAKKESESTEILNRELSTEAIDNALEESITRTSENHVIIIEEEVGNVSTTPQDEQ